jgi:hypothetical protein
VPAKDRGSDLCRTRLVVALECREHRFGQIRPAPRDPSQEHEAFFIGYCRYGIDHLDRWGLTQQQGKSRAALDAAHTPQSTGRSRCNQSVEVAKQIDHQGNGLGTGTGATTRAGTNRGIRMPEERHDDNRRKVCAECGGRFGGDPQAGPLHDLVDDDSRHGLRRVATPDQAKTVKCRDLLGDGVLHTEALEASAQRLERGYGTGQAPLPDLRREVVAVGERCPWDRGDQCIIIEGTRRQRRPLQAGWNRALRAVPRGTEKIKLSV